MARTCRLSPVACRLSLDPRSTGLKLPVLSQSSRPLTERANLTCIIHPVLYEYCTQLPTLRG